MNRQFLSGYLGRMDYPAVSYHYGPSIFAMTDVARSVLVIVPLNYAFYREAYEVAKSTSYMDVCIVMMDVNERTVSDLFNLCLSLAKLKGIEHVKWLGSYKTDHVDMELMHILDSCIHFNNLGPSYYFDFDPNIILKKNSVGSSDLLLWDGYDKHYFTNNFTEEIAERLSKDENVIVNVPYVSADTEGVISGSYLITQKWIPHDRLQIYSFPSIDVCKDVFTRNTELHVGEVGYNAFVQ